MVRSPLCRDCGKPKSASRATLLRCLKCQRAAGRAAKEAAHARHILTTYGITAAEYKALWRFQAGKCAICVKASGASKRLAVDHDHRKGCSHDPKMGCPECVRGLLCGKCNVFLGYLRDDASIGGRIGRYLTDSPWQQLRARKRLAA